jgi:hypothetical protein
VALTQASLLLVFSQGQPFLYDCVLISSYKDTSQIGSGVILLTSLSHFFFCVQLGIAIRALCILGRCSTT